MQCFSYAIRSQSCSADHNSTGRVYNVHYSTRIPRATRSEIASIACLHDFSGPALLSCSKILTYQLLGSRLWTALPLEKSRSRHNSRTKLCMELSLVHNRDNIDSYLHCKFQSLPFSVRRENGVTDRQNDRQTDNAITVCLVAPPTEA